MMSSIEKASIITRRSLLRGLVAAPAIVSAASIMPVKLWKPVTYSLNEIGADFSFGSAGFVDDLPTEVAVLIAKDDPWQSPTLCKLYFKTDRHLIVEDFWTRETRKYSLSDYELVETFLLS